MPERPRSHDIIGQPTEPCQPRHRFSMGARPRGQRRPTTPQLELVSHQPPKGSRAYLPCSHHLEPPHENQPHPRGIQQASQESPISTSEAITGQASPDTGQQHHLPAGQLTPASSRSQANRPRPPTRDALTNHCIPYQHPTLPQHTRSQGITSWQSSRNREGAGVPPGLACPYHRGP